MSIEDGKVRPQLPRSIVERQEVFVFVLHGRAPALHGGESEVRPADDFLVRVRLGGEELRQFIGFVLVIVVMMVATETEEMPFAVMVAIAAEERLDTCVKHRSSPQENVLPMRCVYVTR